MSSSNDHYIINNWEDEKLNLKNNLLRGIYSFGFEKPSSIQKKGLYSWFIINIKTDYEIL